MYVALPRIFSAIRNFHLAEPSMRNAGVNQQVPVKFYNFFLSENKLIECKNSALLGCDTV
jgi:hypothetical protein